MSLKSNYRDGDSFTRRSKKEGYRSRASYKLKELLQTDIKLLKGDSVLDLGSFPGGWSQVASEIVGKSGKVAAIDIQFMEPIEGCFFLKSQLKKCLKKILKKYEIFCLLILFYQTWPPI